MSKMLAGGGRGSGVEFEMRVQSGFCKSYAVE